MNSRGLPQTRICIPNPEGPESRRSSGIGKRAIRKLRPVWPVLIELWMLAILVAFFVIRVVNSNLGRRILAKLASGHPL